MVSIADALSRASSLGSDLVEVSSTGDVPVCRIMDYGKFKYQQSKKLHDAKKHQKIVLLKEVKLRPKIAEHDFLFKLKNAIRFLADGNKVKIQVEFRGRETSHRSIGEAVLIRFRDALGDQGIVEQSMKSEGRGIFLIVAPGKLGKVKGS